MRSCLAIVVTVLAAVVGCNGVPQKVPCLNYVAGNFYAGNNYAFSVNDTGWPRLNNHGAHIELSFLLAGNKPQAVNLVHVVESRELEHWDLAVKPTAGGVARCLIAADSSVSNCGASLRVLPQAPGGYYYLRGGDAVIEAGMSFLLCDGSSGAAK